MIAIRDILVSEDIIEEQFICSLDRCKGACCYEGDLGAPLQDEELDILDEIYPKVRPYLSQRSIEVIENKGLYAFYKDLGSYGTQLDKGGPCVFMGSDPTGVAYCNIEKAWKDGLIDFRKPISCHLYPIRVLSNKNQGFTAINYDRWEICNPGCQLGKQEKMPLYKFVKEAIIRRFGAQFYDELGEIAQDLSKESQDQ